MVEKDGEIQRKSTYTQHEVLLRGSRLIGSSRPPGDESLWPRCCPDHGLFMHHDWLWKDTKPYCPLCKRLLIKVKPCQDHGFIRFKNMIWKNAKPYCPNCNKPLV